MTNEVNAILSKRFDRIEEKIDKLSDAMVTLARAEEKIMAMESDKQNMLERLNRHSEKLDELNDEVKINTQITSNIVKITWVIVTTMVAGLIKMMWFM